MHTEGRPAPASPTHSLIDHIDELKSRANSIRSRVRMHNELLFGAVPESAGISGNIRAVSSNMRDHLRELDEILSDITAELNRADS